MPQIDTKLLEIAYEEGGPKDGPVAILLHGWPDSPRGWNGVADRLQAAGWRTIAPYLRGSNPTRFRFQGTPRVGAAVALAQDAIDLADALELERFAVAGHAWGGRTAYTLAALFPDRITKIAALSVGYQPRGKFHVPGFEQSKRFWYQMVPLHGRGGAAFRRDPIGFARIQWDTWSPAGWFDKTEFQATAEGFSEPDWAAITLNSYRSRWLANEAWDSRYDGLKERLREVEWLSVPTLMIQGGWDFCDPPEESEGLDKYFTGGYQRLVLSGAGHFPQREAPDETASAILRHFSNDAE